MNDSTWATGYCRTAKVTNSSTATVKSWTLTFTLPSTARMTQSWSGTATATPIVGGTSVKVVPPTWAATIPAGGSVNSFGFCADGSGEPRAGKVTG